MEKVHVLENFYEEYDLPDMDYSKDYKEMA